MDEEINKSNSTKLSPSAVINSNTLREYLFNFVMIFLAVFLGFLAENYRESLSDQSKEKEYARSLMLNLKDDSLRLSQLISNLDHKIKGLDSLIAISKLDFKVLGNRRLLYRYIFTYVPDNFEFKSNNATITQLKNSGDLRLLERHHVADSISTFEVNLALLYTQELHYQERHVKLIELIWQLADFTFMNRDLTFPHNATMPHVIADQKTQIIFFNWVWNYTNAAEEYAKTLTKQKISTGRLISFLKQNYKGS